MFEAWPSVIIKKARFGDYNGDASVEVCYIEASHDTAFSPSPSSSSSSSSMSRTWISVCIEHNTTDAIIRY